MICRRCLLPMVQVLSFESDKSYEFFRCKKCYRESRKLPVSLKLKFPPNSHMQKRKYKGVKHSLKNKTE